MSRYAFLFSTLTLALCVSPFSHAQRDIPREPVRTYIDEPIVGWHWYNEPTPQDELEPESPPTIPLTALPPTVQMKVLQKLTEDKLNTVIMYPNVENFAQYMQLQNFWTTQAGRFSQVAQKAMLVHPELDYNLQYSHYNSTAPLQQAADQNKQVAAIQQLSREYGLFFFYRGNDALDSQLAGVVSQFAQQYGIALVPVSMDGARSPSLPNTRPNSGQAQAMNITTLPALYLVKPGAEHYQPLAYGFMTQDALAKRFLSVATDFAPQS